MQCVMAPTQALHGLGSSGVFQPVTDCQTGTAKSQISLEALALLLKNAHPPVLQQLDPGRGRAEQPPSAIHSCASAPQPLLPAPEVTLTTLASQRTCSSSAVSGHSLQTARQPFSSSGHGALAEATESFSEAVLSLLATIQKVSHQDQQPRQGTNDWHSTSTPSPAQTPGSAPPRPELALASLCAQPGQQASGVSQMDPVLMTPGPQPSKLCQESGSAAQTVEGSPDQTLASLLALVSELKAKPSLMKQCHNCKKCQLPMASEFSPSTLLSALHKLWTLNGSATGANNPVPCSSGSGTWATAPSPASLSSPAAAPHHPLPVPHPTKAAVPRTADAALMAAPTQTAAEVLGSALTTAPVSGCGVPAQEEAAGKRGAADLVSCTPSKPQQKRQRPHLGASIPVTVPPPAKRVSSLPRPLTFAMKQESIDESFPVGAASACLWASLAEGHMLPVHAADEEEGAAGLTPSTGLEASAQWGRVQELAETCTEPGRLFEARRETRNSCASEPLTEFPSGVKRQSTEGGGSETESRGLALDCSSSSERTEPWVCAPSKAVAVEGAPVTNGALGQGNAGGHKGPERTEASMKQKVRALFCVLGLEESGSLEVSLPLSTQQRQPNDKWSYQQDAKRCKRALQYEKSGNPAPPFGGCKVATYSMSASRVGDMIDLSLKL